jgi:hypothetical protein
MHAIPLTISSKKKIPNLLFLCVWSLFSYSEGARILSMHTFIIPVLFIFIGLFLLWQVLWLFFGKITSTITSESLLINRRFFFISFSKTYTLKEISKLAVESRTDYTDLWLRHSGRMDKVDALCFQYTNGKEICVGKEVESNDIHLLYKQLKIAISHF